MRGFVLIIISVLLLCGCAQEIGPQVQTIDTCKQMPVRSVSLEKKAVAIAKSIKGIDDATAIYVDKQLNVAIKASNFNMLRVEALEEETFNRLKKAFSNSNIVVSDDSKYFKELAEFGKKKWPKTLKKGCQQKKALKEIEGKIRK